MVEEEDELEVQTLEDQPNGKGGQGQGGGLRTHMHNQHRKIFSPSAGDGSAPAAAFV